MPERLPLHDQHLAAGARIQSVCGWELPLDYGDPAAEYEAVRRAAGLIDRSDTGVLEVTGRDRAVFLHAMLSNDVTSLTPGQGCAASFLDNHGKIQTLVTVLVLEDRILLLTPPGMAEKTLEALDKFLFSEKAYFRDATSDFSFMVLAGPDAPALAERVTGTHVPEAPWSHVDAAVGAVSLRLVRGGGETGEAEVWTVAARSDGGTVWKAFHEGGARPVGMSAFESLRIEAGTPVFGHDTDESVLLPEIPFANRVSYTKGCYIGQEVVVRIRDRGHVNRMLRGLLLDGDVVPPPGAQILAGDAEIGRVTSAAWSFGLKRPIALGFVRRQHAQAGTAVTVRPPGGAALGAVVSDLPLTGSST